MEENITNSTATVTKDPNIEKGAVGESVGGEQSSSFPQIRKESPFAPVPEVVPPPSPFERQPTPPVPQIEKVIGGDSIITYKENQANTTEKPPEEEEKKEVDTEEKDTSGNKESSQNALPKEQKSTEEYSRLWKVGEAAVNVDILEKEGLLDIIQSLPKDQRITVVAGWASERAYKTLKVQKDMPVEGNSDVVRTFIRLQQSYFENVMGLLQTLGIDK